VRETCFRTGMVFPKDFVCDRILRTFHFSALRHTTPRRFRVLPGSSLPTSSSVAGGAFVPSPFLFPPSPRTCPADTVLPALFLLHTRVQFDLPQTLFSPVGLSLTECMAQTWQNHTPSLSLVRFWFIVVLAQCLAFGAAAPPFRLPWNPHLFPLGCAPVSPPCYWRLLA